MMDENLQSTLFELNKLEDFRDIVSINYGEASISDNIWPLIENLTPSRRLPEKLKVLLSNSPRSKFAYSNVNQQYAIWLDGQLEIRGPISGSYKILPEANPNWRKLCWSASCNLLICARSLPILDVFDVRNYCYSIHLENTSTFDPLRAIADIASNAKAVNNTWSDEVYILQYCGILHIYYMGRISGYHPLIVLDLHNILPVRNLVTTAMILCPETNLLVIANVFDELNDAKNDSNVANFVDDGIFLLRLLETQPFVAAVNQTRSVSGQTSTASFFSSWSAQKSFVQQLLLNSDQNQLACVVSSTDVYVFSFPSGKQTLHYCYSLVESKNIILGIAWWTNELILIAFSDGRLTFLNVTNQNFTEMTKISSWFLFYPVTNGHFFVMEQSINEEDKLKRTKNAPSLMWMLAKLPYEWIKRLALIFVGAPPVDETPSTSFPNESGENSFQISYNLQEIKATTPEELFETKLIREEFGEALAVAEKYHLDRDKVYQTQWLKNVITIQLIDDYLAKIKNRKWVVDECVRKIPQSAEICRYLLKFGLKLTQFLDEVDEKKFINDEIYYFHQRLRLLKYLDRLEDYEETRQFETFSDENSFDVEFYTKIRNFDTLSMALYLSRNNHFLALRVLFRRYKDLLYPFWLYILNNICETIDVETYEFLLPQTKNLLSLWDDEPRRTIDFIESSQIYVDLCRKNDLNLSDSIRLEVQPPSLSFLTKWYENRSLEIERFTGLSDLAEKFLIVAVKFGFKDLKLFRDDFSILRRLNYSCKLENAVDYQHFVKLTPFEIANELLKQKTGENFAHDFFVSVIPYFRHCQSKQIDQANRLTFQYLVELSKNSLKPLLFVLQHLFKNRDNFKTDDESLLFGDNLIELTTDCLNVCDDDAVGHLETAFKVLAFLPSTSDDVDRCSKMDLIERRLKAMEILSTHEINFSYSHFRRLTENADETAMLLKRLVRRAIDDDVGGGADTKRTTYSTLHWKNLLKDMINLCDLTFATISKTNCRDIFVDGLLCSKNKRVIQAATSFISSNNEAEEDKISLNEAQRLILSAGLSYVNESVSGDDEALEYAKLCFSLLKTPSNEIRRELDFVTALPMLESFGVKELPTRLRLYVDKSRLIDEIFDKNRMVYKEIKRISTLCHLLRVPNDVVDDARTYALIKCAEIALINQDYSICNSFCKDLIDSNCVDGWHVCRSLAVDENFNEKRSKHELLKFCLAHCSGEELESILNDFVRSKSKLIVEKFVETGVSTNISDAVNNYFDHHLTDDDSFDSKTTEEFVHVRLDSIYSSPFSFVEKYEATLNDESMHDLIDFVHVLSSERSKLDEKTLENFYFALARRSLLLNSMFASGILLNFNDWNVIENCLSRFSSSPLLVELATYLASLTFVQNDVENVSQLLPLTPRDLITLIPRLLCKDEQKLEEYMQFLNRWKSYLDNYQQNRMINQLPEGLIDQRRFEIDEKYRRDSILGFALSTEEKSYLTAVRLAERFDVDERDIHWAHLAFLFTDSGLEANEIQDYIKKRHLTDKLLGEPVEIASKFVTDVYPLLSGTKYQTLLLYYIAVEKLCGDLPIVQEVQIHRTLLRHFMKYAPGIDYKKLVSNDSNSLDVVMPYLNADNFRTFAKVLTKIPTKNVTLEIVFSLWARKVFIETMPKVGVQEAFAKCRPVLLKLNKETFVDFARGILLSEKSKELFRNDDKGRLETLDLCLNLVKSEKTLEIAANELESWRNVIAPSVAQVDVVEEPSVDVPEDDDEPDEFEKLLKQAKSLRAEGKTREAGAILLKAYDVPPSFATHTSAMILIKKLDSSGDS